jgi:hypothetical protein
MIFSIKLVRGRSRKFEGGSWRNKLRAADKGTEVSQCVWPLKKKAAAAEK